MNDDGPTKIIRADYPTTEEGATRYYDDVRYQIGNYGYVVIDHGTHETKLDYRDAQPI